MTRLTALDNMKGIAILAVVVFHILRGFQQAGAIGNGMLARFADVFAYGFHIQTFLVIAGFLTFPRAGNWRFQRDRQISLYYPYLLWSFISWGIAFALGNRVNSAVTVHDLLLIPVWPIEHFWFLLILMIGTALLAALRSSYTLALGIFALTVANVLGLLYWYDILTCLTFMAVGALLRAGRGLPPARIWAGCLGAVLLATGSWIKLSSPYPIASIWLIWASFGGVYACYVLAERMTAWPRLNAILSYMGQHSMAIYLLHILGGSGTRIILRAFAPATPVSLAVLLSIAGALVLPLAGCHIARRMGLSRLLGLDPVRITSRPVASVAQTV